MRLRRSWGTWGLVILAFACLPWGLSPSAAGAADVKLKFQCLWWSPVQMEGMNPDAPPPKNTPTEISKWEYSDPVGVPHPDQVDLIGENKGGGAEEAYAVVERRWKVGPLKNRKKAIWERWELSTSSSIKLPVKGDFKIGTVDIKGKMEPLFAKDRWPFELEMRVTLYSDHTKKKTLSVLKANLPLAPGD